MDRNSLEFRFGYDPEWAAQAFQLLNHSGLKRPDIEMVKKGLQNSSYVITCWAGGRLVGIGRMLTDGAMYASIFDIAVSPPDQKKGIGKAMMARLIAKAPDTCIHLTSTFGHEAFYRSLGFRPHKTAMALYPERIKNSPYLA